MKKRQSKKLQLRRETVRDLETAELSVLRGGDNNTLTWPTFGGQDFGCPTECCSH